MKVFTFDTTLRDGTQGEGISLSVDDKLAIARKLDEFGIDYIEGGWPGSNPKDEVVFRARQGVEIRACAARRLRVHTAGEEPCSRRPERARPRGRRDAGRGRLRENVGVPCPPSPTNRASKTISC